MVVMIAEVVVVVVDEAVVVVVASEAGLGRRVTGETVNHRP